MTTDKILRALELRRAGVSYEAIADQIGFDSAEHVRREIEPHLIPVPTLAEQRALELDRLERMQQLIWPKVQKGDASAVALAVQLGSARMRLLRADQPEVVAAAPAGVVNDLAAFKSKSRSRA